MIIFTKLFGKRCEFCKQKTRHPSKYMSRKGTPIYVCSKCRVQAERTALKKL